MFAATLASLVVAVATPAPSPTPTLAPIGHVTVATQSDRALHRLPLPAAAFDPALAFAAAGSSTDALLRTLPGLDRNRGNATFSNYGLDRVSIAGAGNDRGALFVDGIPAQDPFGGQVDWAAIAASALTRAEILNGPGSALYGSGAIGGVLSLRTFDAADIRDNGSSSAEITAGGLGQSAGARIGVPLGGGWRSAMWSETTRTTFDALPPAYRAPDSTAATTVTGVLRATLRYDGGPFAVELGALDATDAQAEGRPNYTFSRSLQQFDLSAAERLGDDTVLLRAYDRASAVVSANDTFPKHPGQLSYVQFVPDSDNGLSLDLTHVAPHSDFLARAETRLGQGSTTQTGADGSIQDAGDGAQRDNALTIQQSVRSSKFDAVAGLRLDQIHTGAEAASARADRSDAALSPRAALAYAIGDLTLRAYGGGGLRVPYLNELVRSYRIASITYEPNIGLVPERSSAGGLGLDIASGPNRIALDVQSTVVDDAIFFRTISPTMQVRSNAGSTRSDGALLMLSHGAGCDRFDASVAERYARVTADVDPTLVGKRLAYVPDYEASLAWTRLASPEVDVRLSYAGQTYADDRNTQPLGTATLLDVALVVPLPGAALSVGASNAAGVRYLSSPDRLGPPATMWIRISVGKRAPACARR